MSSKAEVEKLRKLENHFREAIRDPSWKDFEKNATKVFRYKENDQWTASDLKTLEDRGQPEYTNNQVKVTIDRLNGQFAQLKSRIGFRPRNEEDQDTANVLTDIYRYIYQSNGLEFHERDCADDGFTSGRGVLEVTVDFDDDFQPEIRVRAEDTLSVHPDPHSTHYDWNIDALYICRSKWVDVDEAAELYPEKKGLLKQLLSSEDAALGDLAETDELKKNKEQNFVDTDRRRIRLVEVQYKKKRRETIWLSDDKIFFPGEIKDKEGIKNGYERLDRIKHKIWVGVFTQDILLEDTETEKERFSMVQYIVHRKKSGEPYGPAYPALPLQDSINKRGSKAMHLLNSNRVFFEHGTFTNKDNLAIEMAKPDGQVEVNEGKWEKFHVEENRELAAAHMGFHDSDLANFRRVTGVNPDALGEKSEIRSGVGIARKVAQTETVVAGAFDNFRRTREALAYTVLDCVQNYYTPRKIELITDDNEAAKHIELDNKTLESVKQGKYDVVVAEMPNLINTEEEQFQTLTQMLPTILPFGPFWMKLLIKASNLRDKDDFIKSIEEIPKGPQIQPKMSITAQLDNMSPVERAYLYQQMGAQEVAEAVMQENRQPTSALDAQEAQLKLQAEQMKQQGLQAKIQGDIMMIQAKIRQAERELELDEASAELQHDVERLKAEAEEKKAESEIIKANLEIVKARLELEAKRLEIQKAEVEVEKSKQQTKLATKKANEPKKPAAKKKK